MNNALLIILVKLWKLIVFLPLKFQNLIAVILGYLISSIPIKRNRISKVNIDLCFKDLSQIERFKIYDKNKKAFADISKIIVFFFPLYSFKTLFICCSVLTKANSFFSYSKLANWDFRDKNILSRVSPVESDTRYTLYFWFINLLIN